MSRAFVIGDRRSENQGEDANRRYPPSTAMASFAVKRARWGF